MGCLLCQFSRPPATAACRFIASASCADASDSSRASRPFIAAINIFNFTLRATADRLSLKGLGHAVVLRMARDAGFIPGMGAGQSMVKMLRYWLAVFLLCAPLAALAQAAGLRASDAQDQRIAKLERQIADSKGAADNAWMLMSSALVLLMTGPGLALFYGGLVRKKNVLATMMQSFALMAIVTVVWAIFGYSLSFGEGNSFIGGLHNLLLHGVGAQADPDYAGTIPAQTFMIYQLMFAIITPALITGAFAERIKFSAMAVFMVLWSVVVYSPMAHMVWGKGGLLNAALGGRFPTLDFAGGTVVHITSGVSALVCALYLEIG